MRRLASVVVVIGALIGPQAALAFDLGQGSPDFEVRERSERLHNSLGWLPGDARASVPGRLVKERTAQPRNFMLPLETRCKPGDICGW